MHRISSIVLIMVLSLSLILGAAGCGSQTAVTSSTDKEAPKTHTLVDCADRSVELPVKVDRVFCTTPVATTNVYMLAPEKLVGWNYDLWPATKEFIPAPYSELPNLGGYYMTNTVNIEELLKLDPDVIIVSSPTEPSMADEIEAKTGKPAFYIKYPVWESGKYFTMLGEVMGVQDRAKELAAYCDKTVQETGEIAKNIPDDKKVRVYYAEGTDGLMSDPKGSIVSEVLDYVGGVNVADVPLKAGGGLVPVTLEQVLAWDPDVIITWSATGQKTGFLVRQIMENPDWQTLQALKEKRIYEAPSDKPFSFFGRLPAANQIVGLKWAGVLLYPDYYKFDVRKEIKEFYSLFYHIDLTEEQLDKILEYADERHLQGGLPQ